MYNFSSNPNDRKYYKIYAENGKYYYISHIGDFVHGKNKKVFIEFEDDLALIRESKYDERVSSINSELIFKYIDKKGKMVLMPDVFVADAFSEGLAAVTFDWELWGYMNKKGEIAIKPKYRKASMFKDGFASVYIGEDDGKWILINNKGEYIQDLDRPLNWKSYTQEDPRKTPNRKYNPKNDNNRQYYNIHEENGEYYYKSHVSDLAHDENEKVFIKFEDDLALIRENILEFGITSINTFKYIDKSGKVILNLDVYFADAFSEVLAAVIPSEESLWWGYVNKNGEMVIRPQYKQASMFKDGFASVYIEEDGGKWILINNKGKYIRDLDEPCVPRPLSATAKSTLKLSFYDSEISPKTAFPRHKEPHCSGRDIVPPSPAKRGA
jgi:hypothetical protein